MCGLPVCACCLTWNGGEASGAITKIKTHTPYLNLHFSSPHKERESISFFCTGQGLERERYYLVNNSSWRILCEVFRVFFLLASLCAASGGRRWSRLGTPSFSMAGRQGFVSSSRVQVARPLRRPCMNYLPFSFHLFCLSFIFWSNLKSVFLKHAAWQAGIVACTLSILVFWSLGRIWSQLIGWIMPISLVLQHNWVLVLNHDRSLLVKWLCVC